MDEDEDEDGSWEVSSIARELCGCVWASICTYETLAAMLKQPAAMNKALSTRIIVSVPSRSRIVS